jgi:hypothetical protein
VGVLKKLYSGTFINLLLRFQKLDKAPLR